jgi:hypothetical protein
MFGLTSELDAEDDTTKKALLVSCFWSALLIERSNNFSSTPVVKTSKRSEGNQFIAKLLFSLTSPTVASGAWPHSSRPQQSRPPPYPAAISPTSSRRSRCAECCSVAHGQQAARRTGATSTRPLSQPSLSGSWTSGYNYSRATYLSGAPPLPSDVARRGTQGIMHTRHRLPFSARSTLHSRRPSIGRRSTRRLRRASPTVSLFATHTIFLQATLSLFRVLRQP